VKKYLLLGLVVLAALGGCRRAADVASENLSIKADNYEIMRRIVLINGITGDYLLEIVGYCALGNNDDPGELSFTCKDVNGIKKRFFGYGDNGIYVVEDVSSTVVSTFHTIINFRPQALIPDVDFQGDLGQLKPNFDGAE